MSVPSIAGGGGERARKVGGEDNGRGTGFIWCKSELKPVEERMHVKIIYTPKKIRGKNSNSISRYFWKMQPRVMKIL